MKNTVAALKLSYLKILCGFLILSFLGYQSLSIGKFCYSENKFLNKQEIIDRYLLGADWALKAEAERAEILSKYKDTRLECCYLNEEYDQSFFEKLISGLIFRKSYYQLEAYTYSPDPVNPNSPYYHASGLIDSCGYEMPDKFGDRISVDEYLNIRNWIKNYRKDHGYAE